MKNFFNINVAIYRMHVVVTWGTTAEQIVRYVGQHNVTVGKDFVKQFREHTSDAIGLCMKFRNDNPDLLVWMGKRPRKASEFGTLYHELYHAVDSISESRNLKDEEEARAYVFEYLVAEANAALSKR